MSGLSCDGDISGRTYGYLQLFPLGWSRDTDGDRSTDELSRALLHSRSDDLIE